MNLLKLLVGTVSGVVVGGALGIAFAVAVGLFSQRRSPNDPSAGSIAIIVMLTFPVGAFLGALAGAILGWYWM
jgi:hypothetical protein